MDAEDVFFVTALMNNETVFSAEINLNGKLHYSDFQKCAFDSFPLSLFKVNGIISFVHCMYG